MAEKSPAAAAPTTATEAPQPLAPRDGALVGVAAVPFEWSAVEDAGEYVLQIARDAAFEDVILTLSVGETTAATLHHTLDAWADEDLHWRVRGARSGEWGPAAHFHAASAARLASERAERDRLEHLRVQAALQQHLDGQHRVPVSLPDEEENVERVAVVVLGVIVLSFVILLVFLFLFGQVTFPAEAQV